MRVRRSSSSGAALRTRCRMRSSDTSSSSSMPCVIVSSRTPSLKNTQGSALRAIGLVHHRAPEPAEVRLGDRENDFGRVRPDRREGGVQVLDRALVDRIVRQVELVRLDRARELPQHLLHELRRARRLRELVRPRSSCGAIVGRGHEAMRSPSSSLTCVTSLSPRPLMQMSTALVARPPCALLHHPRDRVRGLERGNDSLEAAQASRALRAPHRR